MKSIIVIVLLLAAVSFAGAAGTDIATLTKKAEAGEAQAQFELATAYQTGSGVEQNEDAAFQWCTKAAEQGYAKAQNALGLMYRDGTGGRRDKEESFRWYKKAAKQKLPEAEYNVAISYFNGDGVATDLNRAYVWMWLAQRDGSAPASSAFKVIEEQVRNPAVPRAFLAELLLNGEETPMDINTATTILNQFTGKDAGSAGTSGLEYQVCQIYELGKNLPQDYHQARLWCRKAAEHGWVNAFMPLGRFAEEGLGGTKDLHEAVTWYEDAALSDMPDGFVNLIRVKSQSSSHDDQKSAFYWFCLAGLKNVKVTDELAEKTRNNLSEKEREKELQRAQDWYRLPQWKKKSVKYP